MITKARQQSILRILTGLIVTVAAGCAANVSETRQPRAAGVWNFRLPSTQSPVAGLAYGQGGNATPAPAAPSPLLAAKTATATPKIVEHHRVIARPQHAEPSAAAPMAVAEAVPASAVKEPVQLAQAEPNLAQRYGQRESQSRKLERFKGGDVVVIGVTSGAIVIVLLVVLLILLLR